MNKFYLSAIVGISATSLTVSQAAGTAYRRNFCLTSHPFSIQLGKMQTPAIPYSWRNVEIGGGGGFVDGIVFHPKQPDLIYARTDIGGVYRWDAASKRWIALTDWVGQDNGNLRGAESIALDPTDPKRVYVAAGTYNGQAAAILRSTDQGRTWQQAPVSFSMGGNEDGRSIGERLAVDPSKPSTIYFGSRHDGLWRSIDFGATWNKVATFPILPDDAPIAPGALWHAPKFAGIGWIVFDPRGAAAGSPTPTLYAGAAAPGVPAIFRSDDAGVSWRAVSGQPADLIPQHAALAADGALYVTYANALGPNGVSNGGVWRYDTQNGVWTDITPIKSSGYAGLSLDTEHPGTLMVSTLDHWTPTDEIFRSTDRGTHWTPLSTQATRDASAAPWLKWGKPTARFGWWIGALAIDPSHPGRVLYGTGATIWGTDDVLPADQERPTRWRVYAEGIEETAVTALASLPAGPHLISGVGDIGGFTHHRLTVSPPEGMNSNPIYTTTSGLDFAQSAPEVVVRVGSGNDDPGPGGDSRSRHGAYSINGGQSWIPFGSEPAGSQGAGTVAATADGGTFLWAAQGAPVSYSRDHGATWTPCAGLPQPDPSEPRSYFGQIRLSMVSDRVNPQKVYILDGFGKGLYASTDSGAIFSRVAGVGLPTGTHSLSASPSHEGSLWVVADSGLFHSTDAGATFKAVMGVAQIDGLGFGKAAPGHLMSALYMVGKPALPGAPHGIYRSDDGGATWVRINDDQHQYGWIGEPICGDPRIYGRVYLGTNGRGILYADPSH